MTLEIIETTIHSDVVGVHWRALRQWLLDMDVEFEPTINDESLLGYSVAMRNYALGVGLIDRHSGPALTLSAILCRGMDRPNLALEAVNTANAQLSIGQMLLSPNSPPELSFFLSMPLDLLDGDTFAALLTWVLQDLNEIGFSAVMAVGGYHPTDPFADWIKMAEDLETAEASEVSVPEPRVVRASARAGKAKPRAKKPIKRAVLPEIGTGEQPAAAKRKKKT